MPKEKKNKFGSHLLEGSRYKYEDINSFSYTWIQKIAPFCKVKCILYTNIEYIQIK